MALTVQKLAEERIIIMNFAEPFVGEKDLPEANKITSEFMDEVGEQVYRIENVLGIDLDFSKIVAGLGAATKVERGSMSDPNVTGLFVGEGNLAELTADSFSQEQYGGNEIPFFITLDEALTFIRSKA